MKNTVNILLVGVIMVFVIGCNCGFGNLGQSETTPSKPNQPNQPSQPTTSQNENKSLSDKATDVVTTGEKIGVPECDELMDYFRTKIENENTDFLTKAFLKTLEAQFRDGIKKSLEQNNADKAGTAAFCKEFKKNLDEQEAKK